MSVLIVAAHPDDEVLGCGATAALLARRQEVRVVVLGEGLTARAPDRRRIAKRALARLRADAKSAVAQLGVRAIEFGSLPDNRFDSVPLLDIVKHVERWIRRFEPAAVYTHHPGDLNIDHAITCRAVLTATRPVAGCPVRAVYAFEVPSSTEWAFQRLEPVFRPNVFVDVSSTMEAKIRAMACYAGESRLFPHPRSPEALRAIARRWGSLAGLNYAEAFELIREIRP